MSKITNNGLTQPGTRCFIAMIMLGLTDAARLKHNVVVSRGHCRGGRCLSLCEYNGLQSCVCDKGFCGCFFFGSISVFFAYVFTNYQAWKFDFVTVTYIVRSVFLFSLLVHQAIICNDGPHCVAAAAD